MTHRFPLLVLATAAACGSGVGDDIVTVDTIDAAMSVDAGPETNPDIDAALPAGERCADAARVTLDAEVGSTSFFSTTAQYVDDYDIAACGGHTTTPGPDRVFIVNVPAGDRLIATVKSVSSADDPALYIIKGPAEACDAAVHTCLAAADVGTDGDYERFVYRNTSTTALDVYVVVDGAHADGGAFRLDVWIDAIPPTPVGDSAALAEHVDLQSTIATVRGTTSLFSGYEDDYAPSCTSSSVEHGNDHVYTVTVPAGKRLAATLAPKFSAALYFLAGTSCAGGASGLPGAPAVATYDNTTAAPVDLLVVVDSYRELTGGTYQLDLALTE